MVEVYKLHGLSEQEYKSIVEKLGREPNQVELGILGALWSEHCSYKSSKRLLKLFPTQGEHVIQGPGENAGVVKLDDQVWLAFKIESHNHPSFIEPFNGSATGVGGIIRDVLSMGARPIALMDSLRFGFPLDAKTRYIVKGVVKGISHYGNSIGVPTVGGETFFEECYKTNPLVNAFCLGIIPAGRMLRARGTKAGQLLFLIGSSTGRDGIHGAVMASGEFGEDTESKRPNVQVGDPYFGKKLIEAIMRIVEEGLIVGMQDLGAAGLAGASSELANKSKMGVELYLEKVPLREQGMTPYEILLSESQERMLLVVEKEKVERLKELAKEFHLEGEVVGKLTEDGIFRAYFNGELVAELPVSLITEEAPVYQRPSKEPDYIKNLRAFNEDELKEADLREALYKLLSSPNVCSKEWIYSQYDYQVGTNTVLVPGADSAILRVKWVVYPELKSEKLIALSCEGNGRMVFLNPYEGGKYLIAEVLRNLACVGAKPLGITDCLNFGNPERPEIMWQLEKAVSGMADACKYFGVPVVSGNVSLYNETVESKEIRNVYPTPIVVAVGSIEGKTFVSHRFEKPGSLIFLIGDLRRKLSLGGSEYLKVVHGIVAGDVPVVDLKKEKALQEVLIKLIEEHIVLSAHDVSTGGLLIALLECVFGTGFGLELNIYTEERLDRFFFSESPTRVVVSVEKGKEELLKNAVEESGLDWMLLGKIKEESELSVKIYEELILREKVEDLERVWREYLTNTL
ncbi:phosphoribosylformylglycinamidine synthase subunit PurL [Thermocrinis sp.]|uniref:phosphoribosylformylglycinamidine synthase subunit PurL n=1 Tax=Thermocrinis sp. TaxID=2024383 RepID=UPI002FDDE462